MATIGTATWTVTGSRRGQWWIARRWVPAFPPSRFSWFSRPNRLQKSAFWTEGFFLWHVSTNSEPKKVAVSVVLVAAWQLFGKVPDWLFAQVTSVFTLARSVGLFFVTSVVLKMRVTVAPAVTAGDRVVCWSSGQSLYAGSVDPGTLPWRTSIRKSSRRHSRGKVAVEWICCHSTHPIYTF